MSRKGSRVGGDPVESTGSPARESDDQEREGMSESLNSETGRGAEVLSTPDCQTSASGQEQGSVGSSVSLRTSKQTMLTYYLTAGQQGMALKPNKVKSRKSRGVKASGSGGTKPSSAPSLGKGKGVPRILLEPKPKPDDIRLLADASESSDTEDENVVSAQLLSRSPQESKPDQFALSPVTPPKEPLIPGDITTPVTDIAVSTQDSSSVPGSTRPSSSTPVKQEETTAQILQVSAEVYVLTESERGAVDASESPLQALSHMSLGTQVDSDLPYHGDPSLSLPRSTDDKPGLCLKVDQTKSMVEVYNQIRAELQLTQDPILGGGELAPLSDEDMTAFEQLVLTLGLENIA